VGLVNQYSSLGDNEIFFSGSETQCRDCNKPPL